MNPMTNVKNIKKLSEEELKGRNKTSWHEQYRGSAWIFVGGLPYDLTEGDIICVFSQYGEPVNVNLVRDKETGKSKGFCFICYEDQRSTDLAVDNLNGIKLLGRILRVDHVEKYKPPKIVQDCQLQATAKVKAEKIHKGSIKHKDDSSSKAKSDTDLKIPSRKTVGKRKQDDNCTSKDTLQNKKKKLKVKKIRKKQSLESDAEFDCKTKIRPKRKSKASSSSSFSSSSSSSSSSPFSSSSPSTRSSSSSSLDENYAVNKKQKKSKYDKSWKQKKNRTIEDLRREARLIQAELKRRQQIDEQTKKSGTALEGNWESRNSRNSKERSRNIERHDKAEEPRESKDVIIRGDSGARRHTRTPDKLRENDHKHRYRNKQWEIK